MKRSQIRLKNPQVRSYSDRMKRLKEEEQAPLLSIRDDVNVIPPEVKEEKGALECCRMNYTEMYQNITRGCISTDSLQIRFYTQRESKCVKT